MSRGLVIAGGALCLLVLVVVVCWLFAQVLVWHSRRADARAARNVVRPLRPHFRYSYDKFDASIQAAAIKRSGEAARLSQKAHGAAGDLAAVDLRRRDMADARLRRTP